MMTRFRTYYRLLVPAFLLMAQAATAQMVLPSGPLSSDPARAVFQPKRTAAAHRTAALSLPFFDDFTTPLEGAPKVQNWVPTGGAFVSNRLAVAPPTRGAATLDGIKANGQSYSGSVSVGAGTIDSLVSQPIDLSGYNTGSRVYLSFAWQAGSIIGAPALNSTNSPVRLDLYLLNASGNWVREWRYTSQNVRTGFRQQLIDLNRTQFLHGNFQFMFVASGNTSSNGDTWSIDYVLLDQGQRTGNLTADTVFVDVATGAGLVNSNPSGGLRSPLRRFTAMPVWQFNAASPPSSELSPITGVNLTNLEVPLSRPIDVQGTVRDLGTNTVLGTWLQASYPLPPNRRQYAQTGAANAVALPTGTAPKRLRYTLFINSGDIPRAQPNDTISRDLELGNYFAFDDGTAELYTNLPVFATGQQAAYAYRIDLNQDDHVGGLRMYPVYTASDVAPRSITIAVWPIVNGKPGATALATKTVTMPGTAPANAPPYIDVAFDVPVSVSGTFFVGYSQPSNNRTLHYGLDVNSTTPTGYLWNRDNAGVWDSVRFPQRRKVLMMRPVMTNNVTTASASAREAAAFGLYPNPAHGPVTITGPGFVGAAVLDAVGRTVWEQPAAQAGQPSLALPSTLAPGVYTVRLTLADGRTVGRRLLLE